MIIKSKKVYIEDSFKEATIQIEDGKFIAILPYDHSFDKDYGQAMILPGFYDIHSHGNLGHFTNTCGNDGLNIWRKEVCKEGVCGILPTTVTGSEKELTDIVKKIKENKNNYTDGANILGINLEGPYINPKYKGAHPLEQIRKAKIDEFERINKSCDKLIKIVTLAPELDENHEFIKYLCSQNINPSIGHSDATYKQALEGLNSGCKSFTHTYNSMSPFKHRENGAVGCALTSDSYAEIICDGQMISNVALQVFFTCKKDKAIMVSDCLPGKNLKPGSEFEFGGKLLHIDENGLAKNQEGNIAGSTLHFNDGLRRLVEEVNVPFKYAIDSCSKNPMEYLGIKDRGEIKIGNFADLTILDENYEVIDTYVDGKSQIM